MRCAVAASSRRVISTRRRCEERRVAVSGRGRAYETPRGVCTPRGVEMAIGNPAVDQQGLPKFESIRLRSMKSTFPSWLTSPTTLGPLLP